MSTKRARTKSTTPQLLRALEYRGLLTRVAQRLKLHRTHVSRVAHGHRKSAKVLQALLAEVQRLERRAA
jgi:DNA-binding MarR family transcriptional regulator